MIQIHASVNTLYVYIYLIMQIKEFFFIYLYFLADYLHILMIDVYKTTSSSEK